MGNYEDTHFGRACYIPASMIPFGHKAYSDSQTQRLNNLSISATKSAAGERCITSEDCIEGLSCNSNYRCEN
jgi:hypothetical protein